MREHGIYSVERSGQVLLIRCEGAWNREAANRYAEEVLQIARTMGPEPWGSLADLREWQFGTPDSTRPVVELFREMTRLGRTHAAAVIGEREFTTLVTESIRSHVEAPDTPEVAYFKTPEAARAWLEDAGYAFKASDDGLTPG